MLAPEREETAALAFVEKNILNLVALMVEMVGKVEMSR
jgi:hypothetical protein